MIKRASFLITLLAAAVPSFSQTPGWIGLRVVDQPDGGVLIRGVEPNGPAARAGLKSDDFIVEFNNQDITGVLQFARLVRETPPGRTVELSVRRDNREETFQVMMERTPGIPSVIDLSDLRDRIMREMPDIRPPILGPTYGVRVDALTPQLREFFGVSQDEGVLVSSVASDSIAGRAGLKAGDVITAVDGKRVSTPQDFSRQIRSGRSTVTLTIVRDKQAREIQLEGLTQRPDRPRREGISSSSVDVL
jgi:serine protease Do